MAAADAHAGHSQTHYIRRPYNYLQVYSRENLKDAVSWICPVLRLTPHKSKSRAKCIPVLCEWHIIEAPLLIRLISDRASFHFALLPQPPHHHPPSAAALPVTRMAHWQLCLSLLTITCCAANALGAHAGRPVHLPPTLAFLSNRCFAPVLMLVLHLPHMQGLTRVKQQRMSRQGGQQQQHTHQVSCSSRVSQQVATLRGA